MKNAHKLAVLCLLAVSVGALAQDGPKLVGERKIMELGDGIAYSKGAGAWSMRLRPGGGHVLYIQKKKYKTAGPDGAERQRRGYKLVLRDLKTGVDTALPIPALFDDDFTVACLSMTVFDPAGKTLVVPAGQDTNKNGFMDAMSRPGEKCKPALYDVASGKLKTLDLEADMILPTFSPDGKTLVVLAIEMAGKKAKVHVTPTDKIKFRPLRKPGLIRSICPTSDLMAMVLLTEGERPQPGKFVLYDLKADTVKAELSGGEQSKKLNDYNPQWTADGRYLYWVQTKEEERDGRRQREYVTRIWDAQAGKEAGILSGVAAIGAGPGKGTMVLTKLGGLGGEIVLHAPGDKTLGQEPQRLGDASTRPISTQGKWLLYIRKQAGGAETAWLAEIAMPSR